MEGKNNKMTMDKLAEITQKGFEELRGDFKSELKNEIGGLRDEFKSELKNEVGGLRFEIKDEVGKLRNELKSEMSEKFDSVLSGQDHILKRLDDLETDSEMDTAVHHRHEDKLENHEERIVVVEEKVLV